MKIAIRDVVLLKEERYGKFFGTNQFYDYFQNNAFFLKNRCLNNCIKSELVRVVCRLRELKRGIKAVKVV